MTGSTKDGYWVTWRRWIAFGAIAILGVVADLWTKSYVFGWLGLPAENPPYWLIENYFGFETAVNTGALGGFGSGWGRLFAGLGFVAFGAIVYWLHFNRAIESRWLLIALGLVVGGIFGNMYDRFGLWNPPAERPEWRSAVRDWILFRYGEFTWPNFNIADSLLVCGAIMLVAHSLFLSPAPMHVDRGDSPKS